MGQRLIGLRFRFDRPYRLRRKNLNAAYQQIFRNVRAFLFVSRIIFLNFDSAFLLLKA